MKLLFKAVYWIIASVFKMLFGFIPLALKLIGFCYRWMKRAVVAFVVFLLIVLWRRRNK